jgi:hypothetical protein
MVPEEMQNRRCPYPGNGAAARSCTLHVDLF